MAVAVALLMIGGEFDLSAGAMTGFTGLVVGVLTTEYGLNIWVAMLVSLGLALGVGFLNGLMVMRPDCRASSSRSARSSCCRASTSPVTKALIGQVAIQGMRNVPYYDQPQKLFGSSFDLAGGTVLMRRSSGGSRSPRSRPGCCCAPASATGSSPSAGRSSPPGRSACRSIGTKIGLFMTTAGCGWLVGMLLLFSTSTVQSNTGVGQEFIYIICAVVGGCLLTGGYGSAIGAAFGALIYGMANQGIVYAGWDNNWLKAFLGVMLLGAVLLNEWVRKRAEEHDERGRE